MFKLKKPFAQASLIDVVLALVLAVALVKLIDSVVVDVMMPLVSHFFGGGHDMANYFIPLAPGVHSDMTYEEARKIGAVVGYGQFIIALVYFIIAATLIGLIVSGLKDLNKEKGGAAE